MQRSEDDVSQFDTKFTKQIPVDSPEESTLRYAKIFKYPPCAYTSSLFYFFSESANMMFQGFTYVAPSVLEEMNHPRVITARSPRRTPRGTHREDHMSLRVFPGASTSSISSMAAGISNQPQQFYPGSSHLQNNNSIHPRPNPQFAASHLQGFSNTPTSDDTMMMDVNIS